MTWQALEAHIDDSVWKLQRSPECFAALLADPQLECQLPKKSSLTTGAVLKHAIETFNKCLQRHGPMVFKIGFTADPRLRFRNPKWGYAFDPYQRWRTMVVLYASSESTGPSFLEAAMIEKFKGPWYQLWSRFLKSVYWFPQKSKYLMFEPFNSCI